jgi:hypothetical protein
MCNNQAQLFNLYLKRRSLWTCQTPLSGSLFYLPGQLALFSRAFISKSAVN